MNILLTNDDGIEAAGMGFLAKKLAQTHEVTIVAPESNRSGVSHSITWLTPIRIREKNMIEGVKSFCTSGTPADCVVAATTIFPQGHFDLLISGINHGQNLGVDLRYSGTISAAFEGRMQGLPAIAVSLASESSSDFSGAIDFLSKFIIDYDWGKLPEHYILNINVPALPRNGLKGIACTRPGGLLKRRWFERSLNEWGEEIYWMKKKILYDSHEADLDFVNVQEGFISVSPVNFFQSCEESYRISLEEDLESFKSDWMATV